MAEWFAHSARHGHPTQTYAEHITNVTRGALSRARRMLRHYDPHDTLLPTRRTLRNIVGDAASHHDLGKLDDANQAVLGGKSAKALPIRHEDAGVAALSRYGALEAAGLVSAHHRGLPKYCFELQQPSRVRVTSRKLDGSVFNFHVQGDHPQTIAATTRNLEAYLQRHEQVLGPWSGRTENGLSQCKGFTRRVLLSCLVDADHSDTSRHYGQEVPQVGGKPRWEERLEALDRYVARLAEESRPADSVAQARQDVRADLYAACRDADTEFPLRSCDAVVGSGKTTAIMAHLLRVAATKKLRHIFVVLPYTNIIRQSVKTYRDALCLSGEIPEEVIVEHHHQAAFKDVDLRHLTTLWRAPIIVTTAVQFFETMASNHTGKLRKLHELPGSAVFLDEAHAALPSQLWPTCWNWLRDWVEHWNGHLVLASGSLPEFWTLEEFKTLTEGSEPGKLSRLPTTTVLPLASSLGERMHLAEHSRVRFASKSDPLLESEFIEWVEKSPGPRLVIVNTVQAAAILAKKMQDRKKQQVLHLSTVLAPLHRVPIINRIEALLKTEENWTLVATSMVEAGMNFSFATGFRQRCSTASLVQTGGRVNRGADFGSSCQVWDFDLQDTATFPNNHKALRRSKQALSMLFSEGMISPDSPTDLRRVCLDSMRHEFSPAQQIEALQLVTLENRMDYPEINKLCRVIDSDTRLVLIDRGLLKPIRDGVKLPSADLISRSVQMYGNKIADFGFEPVLEWSQELYVLPEGWTYDPDCFGYMAGWFEQQKSAIASGFLV